jgi:hypothetical protein
VINFTHKLLIYRTLRPQVLHHQQLPLCALAGSKPGIHPIQIRDLRSEAVDVRRMGRRRNGQYPPPNTRTYPFRSRTSNSQSPYGRWISGI